MLCCSQTISVIATSKHMIVELPQKILKPEPVNIAVYPRVNPVLKNLLLPETDMSDDRELSMPWTLAVRESPKQSGVRITCAVVTFLLLRFLSLCPGKIAGPGNSVSQGNDSYQAQQIGFVWRVFMNSVFSLFPSLHVSMLLTRGK